MDTPDIERDKPAFFIAGTKAIPKLMERGTMTARGQ